MISIAICTHNRSEDVAACLSALAPQLTRQSEELILVDSCSDAQHATALQSLSAKYETALVRLNAPGLSLARNEALRVARGEWVAFLDDDTVPAPNWFLSLERVVTRAASNVAGIGGQTEPLWPMDTVPCHISKHWLFFLSCIQDQVRRSVRDGGKVCGANLAFRKESLLAIGGFRAELGRIGDRLIGGEESLAIRLLLRAGQDVVYDPSIMVKHRIHKERLNLAWIKKRAYWEGVTEVAMIKATDEPFPFHLAVPKLLASVSGCRTLFAITGNLDFLIRSQIAAGALTARFRSFDAPQAAEQSALRAAQRA